MTAPVLADPPTGPHQPGTPWPDPKPYPGGPTGPRYAALAESQRAAARATSPGVLVEPLDDWDDSYAVYWSAGPQPTMRWNTTCLGPYHLGERCLHRVAARRLALAEVCEGCTRLLMDELTGALPDLMWHPDWWMRAGLPDGGPS